MIEIKEGKFILKDFPSGRKTIIKWLPGDQFVRRVYNGHSRLNYPDERPICEVEMWATLVEAGEEQAVKESLSAEDFDYVMRHYFSGKCFAHPRCLRA